MFSKEVDMHYHSLITSNFLNSRYLQFDLWKNSYVFYQKILTTLTSSVPNELQYGTAMKLQYAIYLNSIGALNVVYSPVISSAMYWLTLKLKCIVLIILIVYTYIHTCTVGQRKNETPLFISIQIIIQKWNWYQSS